MKYYNTTNEGENLNDYTRKAMKQDEVILLMFQNHAGERFGASDIALRIPNYPITSIRRSLNTLENDGKLTRPGEKKKGMYGRDEYVYTLVSKQLNLF